MGLFSSEDSVKISEKTGGAYADMSDVIDDELNDIFGSSWTHHDDGSHHEGSWTNCADEDSENGDKESKP